MPERIDELYFDVRGRLTHLDNDLRQVDSKWDAAKRKIESKGLLLKLKLDDTAALKQVDDFVRKMEQRVGKPIKIKIDTSDAEQKIGQLEARLNRMGTGNVGRASGSGGFNGATTGGSYGGAGAITSIVVGAATAAASQRLTNLPVPVTYRTYDNRIMPAQQQGNFGMISQHGGPTTVISDETARRQGDLVHRKGGAAKLVSTGVGDIYPDSTGNSFAHNMDVVDLVPMPNVDYDGEGNLVKSITYEKDDNIIFPMTAKEKATRRDRQWAGKRESASRRSTYKNAQRISGFTGMSPTASFGAAKGLSAIGGVATGVGIGLVAVNQVAQYLGGVGTSQANGIAAQQSINAGINFDPDAIYDNALGTGFMSYYGNAPLLGGIGRGMNNFFNAPVLASAQAGYQKSLEMRQSLFTNQNNRAASGVNNATSATDRIQAAGTAELTQLAQQKTLAVEQARNGVGGKTAAQVAASFDELEVSTKARIARDVSVSARTADVSSRRSISISDASVNDRFMAGRLSIDAGYDSRVQGADRVDARRAIGERAAARSAYDTQRRWNLQDDASDIAAQGLGIDGYGREAGIASADSTFNRATRGLKTSDPEYANAASARANSIRSTNKQYDMQIRESNATTRSGWQSLGGNTLGASLTQIESDRQSALASNASPDAAASINSRFNMQTAAAKISDARGMAQYGMGTRSINMGTNRQGMANSGNYIKADAQGIIDETTLAIQNENLDPIDESTDEGKSKGDARRKRVQSLKDNAESRLKGVRASFTHSLTAEGGISAYEIMGGAGGQSELADKAIKDIQGLGKQTAEGREAWDKANSAPPSAAGGTGANGAWTPEKIEKMLDYLKGIAENVGVQ